MSVATGSLDVVGNTGDRNDFVAAQRSAGTERDGGSAADRKEQRMESPGDQVETIPVRDNGDDAGCRLGGLCRGYLRDACQENEFGRMAVKLQLANPLVPKGLAGGTWRRCSPFHLARAGMVGGYQLQIWTRVPLNRLQNNLSSRICM